MDIFLGRVSVVPVLLPIVGVIGVLRISGSVLDPPLSTLPVVTFSPQLDLRMKP